MDGWYGVATAWCQPAAAAAGDNKGTTAGIAAHVGRQYLGRHYIMLAHSIAGFIRWWQSIQLGVMTRE